jgi:hypothetical protein
MNDEILQFDRRGIIMKISTIFKQKYNPIILALFFWLISSLLRIGVTSDYNFPYWFDSGRDAILSREILEKPDFKIQGPSASGTNDTIFHGVLFFYIIGPLYTLFQGDPQFVLYGIILISSFGVVPFYLLALRLTKNPIVANVSGLLYVFSFEVFKGATWFSNPVIAVVSLPLFYYLYWLIFSEGKRSLLPWLLLLLAITHQAGILYAPWWGLIILGFIYEYINSNLKKWKVKTIIYSLVAYLLGISSMILTQLKLMKAGIFSLASLPSLSVRTYGDPALAVEMVFEQYYSKILKSITPTLPVISLFIFVGILYFAHKKIAGKAKLFLITVFSAPLLLLGWHYRIAYHTLLTVELVIILTLAMIVTHLWKQKLGKLLASVLLVLFVMSNASEYSLSMQNKSGEYFVPQGSYLKDLVNAIDYSYKEADGKEFSISTITNPYGYNTLWAYLYSWYGMKKYNYLPDWYGPDQTGIFGGDILSRVSDPHAIHFSIREPDKGIPSHMFDWFELEQNSIATPSAINTFGTIDIRKHEPYSLVE